MKFDYQIEEKYEFEKAYKGLINFVSSKVQVKFVSDQTVTITSDKSKDYEWHLFELGARYGGNLFRNQFELKLIDHKSYNREIDKPIQPNKIKINTKWNTEIEFNPIYLNLAEAYMVNKLGSVLSDQEKQTIKKKVSDFDFEQKISFVLPVKHAYQIIDGILIIIRLENDKFNITDLWKIKWNEKKI